MLIRILKFLTIFILILIVGFFALGLFVPQVEYQCETVVEGPIGEVFENYNDLESIDKWIPDIKSVKPLKETEDKKGSVYEMVIDSDGTEVKMAETVLDYQVNRMVALQFETGPMEKRDVFNFLEENGQTIITGNHVVTGTNYFYKCMFALFKGALTKVDQGYLDNFKEYHEKRK